MLYALIIILAYLIGSIPSGLIIGKVFYGTDIREHGSGNLGATNTFRILGVKAGLIVTIADILKGTLATFLPSFFGVDMNPLLSGVFAAIGHMFPVFAGFRGGKAVATSAGILLGHAPLLFVFLLAVFFIVLKISKYVSLSSMVAGLAGIVYCLIFHLDDLPLIAIITLLTAFVIYRHRANIKRIREKTEPKVKWI